jgi:hypothetical protein
MAIRLGLSLFLLGSMVLGGASMAACNMQTGDEVADADGETATSEQAAQVNTTAATVTGTCAQVSEVGMDYGHMANFKVAGGWSSYNTSGNGITGFDAVARTGCDTSPSPSTNAHKNNVICFYDTEQFGIWKGPQLGASKTFPSNYACTCTSSTGKYTCVRQ